MFAYLSKVNYLNEPNADIAVFIKKHQGRYPPDLLQKLKSEKSKAR